MSSVSRVIKSHTNARNIGVRAVLKGGISHELPHGLLADMHLRAQKRGGASINESTHDVLPLVLVPQKNALVQTAVVSADVLKPHVIPLHHSEIVKVEVLAPQKKSAVDEASDQSNKWQIALPSLPLSRYAPQKFGIKNAAVIAAIMLCHIALAFALFLKPVPLEAPQVQEISIEMVIEEPASAVQLAQEQPQSLDIALSEPAPVVVDVPAQMPDVVEAAPLTLDPSPLVVEKPVVAQIKPKTTPNKPDLALIRRQQREAAIKEAREEARQEAKDKLRREALNQKRKTQEVSAKANVASRGSRQASNANAERASSADLAGYGSKVRAILQGRINSLGLSDVKGSVGVSFAVSGSGRMASVSIAGSTGDFKADRAIRSVLASSSLPPPPQGQFSGVVTIRIR